MAQRTEGELIALIVAEIEAIAQKLNPGPGFSRPSASLASLVATADAAADAMVANLGSAANADLSADIAAIHAAEIA